VVTVMGSTVKASVNRVFAYFAYATYLILFDLIFRNPLPFEPFQNDNLDLDYMMRNKKP